MKTIRAVFALPILAMALASMPGLSQDHQAQGQRDKPHLQATLGMEGGREDPAGRLEQGRQG